MNRQLYADGTDNRGIMSQVRDLIQGIVPKSKYMLPLNKLKQIADAQGVSIEEANNMVMRWAMGTSDPKGLEKLFIPKMRREDPRLQKALKQTFDPETRDLFIQPRDMRESQDIPEYYNPRLQILDPEQMREEMQNPSMPMRDMRAGGGIMSVARENYGIGSRLKNAFKKVAKIADPIIQAAAVIPNPYQPFAQAYTAGRSLGIGGDYRGLQIGPYTPGSYGGEYGLNPTKGFGGKYGITRTGEGINVFNQPIQGTEFFKLAANTPTVTPDYNIYESIDDMYTKGNEFELLKKPTVVNQTFDFLTGPSEAISKVLNSISTDAMKNIIEAGKLGFALYSSNLAKKDQERINENLARIQREYEGRVAEKKSEYGVGTPMIVTRGEVNPVRAPAANGGRMGYAYGSVNEGIMAAPQIAQQMGMPVGNPRQNQQGVAELDYRDQGGFVPPIGVKEKADDIPAMLSNNEFVFNAKSVKNADPSGNQDPEEGAKVMYTLMKRLENGGMV